MIYLWLTTWYCHPTRTIWLIIYGYYEIRISHSTLCNEILATTDMKVKPSKNCKKATRGVNIPLLQLVTAKIRGSLYKTWDTAYHTSVREGRLKEAAHWLYFIQTLVTLFTHLQPCALPPWCWCETGWNWQVKIEWNIAGVMPLLFFNIKAGNHADTTAVCHSLEENLRDYIISAYVIFYTDKQNR